MLLSLMMMFVFLMNEWLMLAGYVSPANCNFIYFIG